MKILFTSCLVLMLVVMNAQQVETLFNQKRYAEIVKRGEDPKGLSGKDLFRVSQAHLQLGNDSLVVKFADAAIKKGYKGWDVYYAKAIALNNLEYYLDAIVALDAGLAEVPDRKVLLLEKAGAQYKARKLDDAKETYTQIARLWQGNQLANFMICQIQSEIQPSAAAANCFRERLHYWPNKNKFYKEALEQIARIEFFTLQNFGVAEQMYSRLANEFPEEGEYLLFLAQIYHFSGAYEKGDLQKQIIQRAWYDRKFSNNTYKAGFVQIDGFGDDVLQVEVFWNPIREPGDKPHYQFFILSKSASRPLGKISYHEQENEAIFSGYEFENAVIVEEKKQYHEIKDFLIDYLSMDKEKFAP
jgi:hypothetical protein